jgi:hypothetical protein
MLAGMTEPLAPVHERDVVIPCVDVVGRARNAFVSFLLLPKAGWRRRIISCHILTRAPLDLPPHHLHARQLR